MNLLSQIFLSVVTLSISATFIVIAILIIRLALSRFPKAFSYALWFLLLFRLICPVKIPFRFSLNSLLPLIFNSQPSGATNLIFNRTADFPFGNITNSSSNLILDPITSSLSNLPMNQSANSSPAPSPIYDPSTIDGLFGTDFHLIHLLSLLWVVGIFALVSFSIYSYLRIKYKVRTATLVRDNIFESDQITTAFVCGFIKPKIYLPLRLCNQNLYYILAHEQVHLLRRDHIIKPFSYLLLILHWFNPVLWLSFSLMSKDMEMSCDEKVIQLFCYHNQKDYSYSLLNFSCKGSNPFAFSPLAFGENHISSRIKNIIRYKKPPKITVLIALIILICSALFLVTDSNHTILDSNDNNQITNDIPSQSDIFVSGNPYYLKSLLNSSTTKDNNDQLGKKIDAYLEIIMSSPRTSSNPYDYIKAHQEEYDNIIKYGNDALRYLLSQFKTNQASGLRGFIIIELCKELLGSSYHAPQTFSSPEQWYKNLVLYSEVQLPDYVYDGNNQIEKLVYGSLIQKYGQSSLGFTIVAPKIYGSYKEYDYLKVFTTCYIATFQLYNNNLKESSGNILPMAITYQKDSLGDYQLVRIDEAMDGSYFTPSIKKFCTLPVTNKKIDGLADTMINTYRNNQERNDILLSNLKKHLKINNLSGITYYAPSGEVIFKQ